MESFGPVRKIRKSHRSITGTVVSTKAGGGADYESTLERDYLLQLEFDPQVRELWPQPLTIEYRDASNRKRIYTPDVLVSYQDSKPHGLFEVKYVAEVRQKAANLGPIFRAARSYARSQGWTFTLVTERSIRGTLLKNARFLLPFLNPERCWPDAEKHELCTVLRAQGDSSVQSLLNGFSPERRASLLPVMWHLIAARQIKVDLHTSLSLNSVVTLQEAL